jgi:hypothetical protein
MFRSYDHHQVEKYITTLGLLNWQWIRCFIRSHITVIVYIMLRIDIIDGHTTKTFSYVYISNILTNDSDIVWMD